MWGLPIPSAVLKAIMDQADTDHNDEIDYAEFCSQLVRDTVQNARADAHAAMPGAEKVDYTQAGSKNKHLSVESQMLLHDKTKWVADLDPVKLGRAPTQREIKMAKPLIIDHIAERYKNPLKAFQYVDQNNSGKISLAELEHTMQMWNLPIPHEVLKAVLDEADTDHSGEIDYGEFCAQLVRDTVQNARTDAHAAMPGAEKVDLTKAGSKNKHLSVESQMLLHDKTKWVADLAPVPVLGRAPTKRDQNGEAADHRPHRRALYEPTQGVPVRRSEQLWQDRP